MASNQIVPFVHSKAIPQPDVHPAAFAAAQLLLFNGVSPEDFSAAMAWLNAVSGLANDEKGDSPVS